MTSSDPNEPGALAPGAVDPSHGAMPEPAAGAGKPTARGVQALVFKNAALLVVAQVVAMPLSLLVNAVMARYLGAKDFGEIYLAQTFCAFGFLLVTFGQGGVLPAEVAKSLPRAGELLGTGLAWRITTGPAVYLLMAGGCYALGYNKDFQVALALVALGNTLWVLSDACQDTVRGFERTDIAAYAVVGQQLLGGLLVVPALLLGGRVRAVLLAQAFVCGGLALFAWRAVVLVSKLRLSFSRRTLRALLVGGAPFFALSLSMALQPNVDALLLSKLAPVEVVGWHAAARKLVGVLAFPSSALMSAYYPTLSRLHLEDRDAFRRAVTAGLKTSMIVVVPVALGCALYPDLGIRIYSRHAFGPAAGNLRILSAFILFLYFSMMLGTGLAAAGKERPWAVCQLACVLVSAVVDPVLVPWFQTRYGNGGLGVCVSTVLSEALMVAAGIWLTPPGIFTKNLYRVLGLSALAGGAMAGVARLLTSVSPFIAAPLSVVAYGVCLWVTGGIDKEQSATLRGLVARRLGRH